MIASDLGRKKIRHFYEQKGNIMSGGELSLTGIERFFPEDEIIVTKTDTKGIITYLNDVFSVVSGYSESEALGKPHSIIRHPKMPRCVFKLLWDTIESGNEIFAYVNNRARNGDNYWVLAHVTPTFDIGGRIISYHSSRRLPRRDAISKINPIYELLYQEEQKHADRKVGMQASFDFLVNFLSKQGVGYDELVLSL